MSINTPLRPPLSQLTRTGMRWSRDFTTATCTRACCVEPRNRWPFGSGWKNHIDPAHRALTPEIAEAASWMAYTDGTAGRHYVGAGHVAAHGWLGPGRRGHRDPGHSGPLHRRPVRLLRDPGDQSAAAGVPPGGRQWPGAHLGGPRAHLLLHARHVPRGSRPGRGVRHRYPHPFFGVDLGSAGVPAPVRPPPH